MSQPNMLERRGRDLGGGAPPSKGRSSTTRANKSSLNIAHERGKNEEESER